MAEEAHELILKLLREKALLKMEVSDRTAAGFAELKKALTQIQSGLRSSVKSISKNIPIIYTDKGDFEAEFGIADDTLVFLLHTNVFTFENNH